MRTKRTQSLFLLLTALLASTLLTSCYSSQQLVQTPPSRKVSSNPTFLDDVQLSPTGSRHLAVTTHGTGTRAEASTAAGPGLLDGLGSQLQQHYSTVMNVLPALITNAGLYKFIDEWYGTRYHLGGTDKSGIDCSAFVARVYESVFGLSLLRTAAEQFGASSTIRDVAQLREGDLVFFRIRTKRISHVGIYLLNRYFVHASSSQGVMISSLDEKYWQRYFAGAGRML